MLGCLNPISLHTMIHTSCRYLYHQSLPTFITSLSSPKIRTILVNYSLNLLLSLVVLCLRLMKGSFEITINQKSHIHFHPWHSEEVCLHWKACTLSKTLLVSKISLDSNFVLLGVREMSALESGLTLLRSPPLQTPC